MRVWGARIFVLLVACFAAQTHSYAAIIAVPGSYTTYTGPDKAAFLLAAPGLPLEDFDSTVATSFDQPCNGPLNAATSDACFDLGNIIPGIEVDLIDQGGAGLMLNAPAGSLNGNTIDVVGPNSTVDDLSAAFSGSPNAIGLDVLSLGDSGLLSITVTGLSGTIATANVSVATGAPSFFGIIAYEPIAMLTFAGSGIAEGIGNVRFGTVFLGTLVPEPTGMMSLGLLALGSLCAFRLRRRAKVERGLGL